MVQTAFRTNPVSLQELLKDCARGKIQLPDFQRSWVWDEDRIKSLIASISQAFPVGALMTLETQAGAADTFAHRRVEGAPKEVESCTPNQLLLDGQQRMTSLYQTCMRREAVESTTIGQRLVHRWFYIDIIGSLSEETDRIETIFGVPKDKIVKEKFGRGTKLDLSTTEAEYEHLKFPLNQVFDSTDWLIGLLEFWNRRGDSTKLKLFSDFRRAVLDNFTSYLVPVIALGHDTSHEAVCLVFEKVNTGGKALDAFELVTAIYALKTFRLRDDWFGVDAQPAQPDKPAIAAKTGIQARLQDLGSLGTHKYGVLSKVASTDFLQAISLLHSKKQQMAAAGIPGASLPAVRATRQSLLKLPLQAYLDNRAEIEAGFKTAAKFLHGLNIFSVADLPYQTQLVPLAAILAEIGPKAEHAVYRAKLARWFWCGVFGELYGSAIESRFAKDMQQVPIWLNGGPEPSTVTEGVFRTERLKTMRSRLSAAYKGIHVLLMEQGARDFRSGRKFDQAIFFGEPVDIHHVFPKKWCEDKKIDPKIYDAIINKTPLSFSTNRRLGGAAPSSYLAKLETEAPPISAPELDLYLRSHEIDPALLRADAFTTFMADRERRLLALIAKVTGHDVIPADAAPIEGEDIPDGIARDSGITAMAAE